MRCLRAALFLALASAIEVAPLAAGDDPVHSKEYWNAISARGNAVPAGEDPFDLLLDLFRNLGSPDPELRDGHGYGLTFQWVFRQRLLPAEDSLVLVERLCENLEAGIGEQGADSVLLRSFSALNLSIFAMLDLEAPFLEREDFETLLEAALVYLEEEKDLRGRHPEHGWLHSVAHTADLLKFLARSEHLDRDGQGRILDAIGRKMASAGEVLVHGEDERLARAVLSIVARDDFDAAVLAHLLAPLDEGRERRALAGFDPVQHAARQNGVQLLRVLFVSLARVEEPSGPILEARETIFAALESF